MRGYLGVWVPVGAPDNQDIRVKGSDKKLDKTFSATEALDSQVIYKVSQTSKILLKKIANILIN